MYVQMERARARAKQCAELKWRTFNIWHLGTDNMNGFAPETVLHTFSVVGLSLTQTNHHLRHRGCVLYPAALSFPECRRSLLLFLVIVIDTSISSSAKEN